MTSLDVNTGEAIPVVVVGFALTVLALFQVWRRVPGATARVGLVLAILALPIGGAVFALVWAQRCTGDASRVG